MSARLTTTVPRGAPPTPWKPNFREPTNSFAVIRRGSRRPSPNIVRLEVRDLTPKGRGKTNVHYRHRRPYYHPTHTTRARRAFRPGKLYVPAGNVFSEYDRKSRDVRALIRHSPPVMLYYPRNETLFARPNARARFAQLLVPTFRRKTDKVRWWWRFVRALPYEIFHDR